MHKAVSYLEALQTLQSNGRIAVFDPLRKSWTFHSTSAAKACTGRKTLAYGWFRILESFRLGGRTKSDDVSAIDDWQMWTIGFITEVRIESEPQISYRVDAFPLFYELLNACSKICAKREFEVLVGEEIVLEGAAGHDGSFEVKLSHCHSHRILLRRRLRFADALLFSVLKTGELASCLERIDVDLEYFFSKFPIGIYRRGIR